MQQTTLYLMVGYPGAGKTTIAQYIHELTGATHIWVDRERIATFGNPTFSSQESRQLYALLNARVGQLLRDGMSVIYDTDFRFRKDRDHLREIATAAGAKAVAVWLTTDLPTSKRRATQEGDREPTRLLGNMPEQDFMRTTTHSQWPAADEHPLTLAGIHTTKEEVAAQLRQQQALASQM